MKFIDLTGQVFDKWTVLKRGSNDKQNKIKWFCKCACGITRDVRSKDLRRGESKGCQKCRNGRFRHGLSRTPTYKIWAYMIARCHNPKDTAYKWYGNRGIKVCQSWRDDFLNFLEDMGKRPNERSIDRIDNDKGYSKDNCRWATRKEQDYNKQKSVKVGKIYHGWNLIRRLESWQKSEWECSFCKKRIIYFTSLVKTGRKKCGCHRI